MKRIAWLSDIHLNFLSDERVTQFLASVVEARFDSLLISGDIAESHDVCDNLQRMDDVLARPIYFVLGNHDFYYGSIEQVRQSVADLCRRRPGLHYLSIEDAAFELAADVGVVATTVGATDAPATTSARRS